MPALAEDLMQLLLDDRSGRATVDHSRLDLALAGAVILELVNSGRVTPAGAADTADEGDLLVRDASPTGDPVLDKAISRLSRKPLGLRAAVDLVEDGIRGPILDRLVERGLVRRDESKVFGFLKRESWPAADAAHETGLRTAIEGAVLRSEQPSDHTASLIALLYAIGELDDTVGGDRLGARGAALKDRVKQVVPEGSLNDRVRDAVRDAFAVNVAETSVVAAAATITAAAAGAGIAHLLKERAEDKQAAAAEGDPAAESAADGGSTATAAGLEPPAPGQPGA